MSRKAINADGAVSVGPYSHAVQFGNLVYLSGQTPIDCADNDWRQRATTKGTNRN